MSAETCTHQEFTVKTKATYLSNVNRYILEIAVRCAECKQRFAFEGLPIAAVALDGACMSPEGGVARLSMRPQNAALPPLDDTPIANLPYRPDPPPEITYTGEDGEPIPPDDADFRVVE